MPLPAEVLSALAAAGKYDPSKQRDEYDRFVGDWLLYRDLMELDRGRLAALVDKHDEDEDEAKYKIRQQLASAFNLIPTVLAMMRGYILSEEPSIDVQGDAALEQFVHDCDGAGTSWVKFVRQVALPLSMGYGWLDVLVTNPATDAPVVSEQDVRDAKLRPRVFPVTPLMRTNWSVRPNHEYNWMTFRDAPDEASDPFAERGTPEPSYVTVSGARPATAGGAPALPAFWMRSTKDGNAWMHDGDVVPTGRAPVATLYYQRSNDPDRRHFGVSKIAMMAVLTVNTIQLLSWIYEDILANLSLLSFPTRDGKFPKDADGNPAITQKMGAFTAITFPRDAKQRPGYIQGDTAHIKAKMAQVEMNLREIQRLAMLIGASGKVEQASSGVQAVVQRTELFQELTDQASALDDFTYEVFALVKSLATGTDVTREQLRQSGGGPVVSFYKGPYVVDSLPDLIKNVNDVARIMGEVSPTLLRVMQEQLAQQVVYADDPRRESIMDEIERFGDAIQPAGGAGGTDAPGTGDPTATLGGASEGGVGESAVDTQ